MRRHEVMVRVLEPVAAAVVWASLLLQTWLTLRGSWQHGDGLLHGLATLLGFFTVLTNLLVALVLSLPRWLPGWPPSRWLGRADTATMTTASILLVGVAYVLLLRHVWHPHGLVRLADVGLHYASPLLFTGYWWLAVPKQALRWRLLPWWTLYPIGYFALTMLRGAFTGRYPYYFIDAARLGYGVTLLNALGVLAGYVVLAALLIQFGRLQRMPAPV